MTNANEYKTNVNSQYGEDGIIKFLYQFIQPTGIVVEFGAADGFFFSNTANIWSRDKNVEAFLIESDHDRFESLVQNTANHPKVHAIEGFVKNVDDYTTQIADVCSVDVDGNEYQILHSTVTPHQIMVVEYNPTVPPHVDMIQIEDSNYGSSAKSLVRLMTDKGYTLVAVTTTNLIFLYGKHDEFESRLEVLFDYSCLNYVVTGYKGEYDMIGKWPYGFGSPAYMRLNGRGDEFTQTCDADMKEWMRKLQAVQAAKGES